MNNEAYATATTGYLTWCGALARPKLARLQLGDVKAAVAWFRDLTGQNPAVVLLAQSCQGLAAEVPAGVEVRTGGAS